jgi:succinate dehydrogenase hydrophobic anchor subunit
MQLATGFFQSGALESRLAMAMARLHQHTALNCLLVFLFIFHALYGVRTVAMDLGLRRERLLFWICTVGGLILFVVFLAFFFLRVA